MTNTVVTVREYSPTDRGALVQLIAAFRVALAGLRGSERAPDLCSAEAELQEYLDRSYPIFVATFAEKDCAVGYLVCRVDGETVWAESLFVAPHLRRRGIAGRLYQEAEELAQERGQDTVYNWIHPNNDAIIAFLKERGYDVLNLIELRRSRADEQPQTTLQVAGHKFSY